MRWKGRRKSTNVEDSRARGPAKTGAAIGGLTIVIALVVMFMGGDPGAILQGGGGQPGGQSTGPAEPFNPTPEEEERVAFISVVLADTEDIWNEQFRRLGKRYKEPSMEIFRGNTDSACGFAGAAMGPFYCPADETVYIDVSFFTTLQKQLGAPGDFAQAYVIAHEVGHHVQHLLGFTDRVDAARGKVSKVKQNQLSVRLELQADFLAGLWAHHADRTKNILEEGDIAEAMNAASKIGDDALQRKSQGQVVPDSFTHGSSAQRKAWFMRGFRSGDLSQGDTFDDALFNRVSPR